MLLLFQLIINCSITTVCITALGSGLYDSKVARLNRKLLMHNKRSSSVVKESMYFLIFICGEIILTNGSILHCVMSFILRPWEIFNC